MTAFEFFISLFGILLGFSLAEVMSGLVRTIKLRSKVRIGWLTPMLGIFVLLDLTSFWSFAWGQREEISVTYGLLVLGLIVLGLYYFAASLVFPDASENWPDYDDYYLKHRRQVLLAVWLCNAVPNTIIEVIWGVTTSIQSLVLVGLYWLLVAVAAVSRDKRLNGAALAGLISLYVYSAVASFLHITAT